MVVLSTLCFIRAKFRYYHSTPIQCVCDKFQVSSYKSLWRSRNRIILLLLLLLLPEWWSINISIIACAILLAWRDTAMRTGFKNTFEWSTMKLSSSCPAEVPLSMHRHFIFHFPFCATYVLVGSAVRSSSWRPVCLIPPCMSYFLGGAMHDYHQRVFFTWIYLLCTS